MADDRGNVQVDVELNPDKAYSQADNVGKNIAEKVGSSAKKTSDTLQSSVNDIGNQMQSAGMAYSKAVTLPIVAAAGASAAAAVKMDTALTGVRKTVDGTEEQYEALKDAAIEFSKTNAVDPAQILDIQALGAQLGYGIDELQLFGEVVSGLDIATNMNAEEAATELAQFSNIMGMSHDETKNYGSTIVELGNNFATTEADISHMAMRIAGAGKQIGLSEADVLGLATALSSMGIEAEAGGTAISTIMSSIDKSVALNDKNLKTWAETAKMSTADFKKAWQEDAVDALSAVLVGMDKATQSGGNMAVMLDELGINSIRQTDVLKRLASNSEFLGNAVETANDAWKENSALDKEVENRNNSLAAKLEIAKNKVEALAIEVGEPLMDAVIGIIEQAQPLVDALASGAKAFSDLDDQGKKTVLMAVAAVAAFGPLVGITGKLLTSVNNTADGWKKFSSNMKTVGKSLTDISTSTRGASASFGKYFSVVKDGQTTVYKVDKATGTYAQTNSKLARALSTTTVGVKVQNAALKASSVAMNVARGAARLLGTALKTIAPIAIFTALVTVVTKVKDAIEGARQKSADWEESTTGLEKAATRVSNAVKEEGEAVKSLGSAYNNVNVDSIIEQHKNLAKSLQDTNNEVDASVSKMSDYGNTVSELLGKKLDDEQAAQLKLAIEGINEAAGTNYEVVKDAGGAYQVMSDGAKVAKDSILELVEAQKVQIQLDAAKEQYSEAYKQLSEDLKKQADAQNDVTEATKTYEALRDKLQNTPWTPEDYANGTVAALKGEVDEAEKSLDGYKNTLEEVNGQVGASQSAVNKLDEAQTLLTMATEKGASAFTKAAAENMAYQQGVQAADVNLLDFTKTLQKMGYTAEDISSLNVEQANQLAQGWKDGADGLLDAAQEAGVKVPEKLREAGEAAREAGNNAINSYAEGLSEEAQAAVNAAMEAAGMTIEEFEQAAKDAGIEGNDATIEFANGIKANASQAKAAAKNVDNEAVKGYGSGDSKSKGQKQTQDFGKGIDSAKGDAKTKAQSVANEAASNFKDTNGEARTSGQNLAQGFINGMGSMLSNVINKAAELTNGALDTIRKIGKENSPWKTTIQSGKYAAQGLAIGMEKSKKYVKKSAADLSQAIVDAAEKRLSKLKRTRDISIGYEVAYWKEIAKHTKKGTKARSEAIQKRKEAVKKANDELLKAEKTFKSEVTKIQDNLAKETKKAWDTYYQAVETRKNAILGSFNLFDRFRVNSQRSSDVLLENLRTQTEAAEEYKSAMDTLRSKIGEGALYQEIADMGVDALGQIRTLNSMSDAELKEYMELFNRRNEAARQEAVRENQALYNETVSTVKKLTDDANKDIQKAAKTLAKTASKLGTSTANSVKKMANSIAKSSKSIIDSVNASIKAIEKLNKKTTAKKTTSKKSTAKAKAVSAMSIEAVPVTYSYDSSGTANGIARTLGAGYMSQVEDSITKGLAAMTLTATQGNTTNNNSYNQTVNINQPIASPDEIARTMRMQQRYGLAGEY